MTYVLPEKLKDLNPYDPVTEDFRIHLDANESFCEVPENIRQEILNAVSNVAFNRYPDPYARKLCEKAGAYYHVDPKLLTAGNGSDELISLVVPYFLDEGDTMLVAVPDFSMYWFYAPFHKIKVESLQKENSMKTSAEEILQRAKEKNAKLLIFSNPCNPTSLGIGRDDIIKIIEGTDALVIVDEAYMEFENGATGVFVTTTADAPGTNRLELTFEMGKIVCEEGRLFFDKLSTNVSDFCKTEKEGFKKPEYSRIEIETDGQNEQHIGVLKAFAGHILRGTPLVAEGTEGIRGLTLSNAMHLSSWLDRTVELPLDEELFLRELNKKRATSRKKEDTDIVFDTTGTY